MCGQIMSTVVELWTACFLITAVSCEGTRSISENGKGCHCIWTRKVNAKMWVFVSIMSSAHNPSQTYN